VLLKKGENIDFLLIVEEGMIESYKEVNSEEG